MARNRRCVGHFPTRPEVPERVVAAAVRSAVLAVVEGSVAWVA